MTKGNEMPLEHLFDAELRYQEDLEPSSQARDAKGELVGSGDGAVKGGRLAGSLR